MSTIVIMPGGFHPFHAGHYALYQSAKKAFPDAEVYVAATNDMSERPFPFQLKEKLAKLAGVDAGHFVQVKSPFQAKEITQKYNPEQDVLIFVRSEKDRNESPKPGGTKKDGSSAYFQPWTGKDVQPFAKHAYFAYLPTVEFGPGITSATQIRKAWPTLNDKRKTALVMSLYPAAQKNVKLAKNVVDMFDQVMGEQEITEGPYVQRIMHPNKIDLYVRIGKGSKLVATDVPYEILDKYITKIISKYPQFKQSDFSFNSNDKVDEGFGINYPGTYEQENNMFKGHGQRRIGDLTNETSLSESADYLEEK
jgi:glycerol-3-phosphate cytidylyltransferase-like family protein